jgi:hypothetical protein
MGGYQDLRKQVSEVRLNTGDEQDQSAQTKDSLCLRRHKDKLLNTVKT